MAAGANGDYERVECAIRHLDANFRDQPDLETLAHAAGLSPWHFQRVFQRWAGISPKRFLQFATAAYARGLLERSAPLLDAAFDSGLSGPSRLHDLLVATEAVTPGEARRRGAGLRIRHGVHESPFGPAGIALTERGLCMLAFSPPEAEDSWFADILAARWPRAAPVAEDAATAAMARRVFATDAGCAPIPLHLRGTNFQIRVWEALMRVPPATVISYEDLARRNGDARAVRATASALAKNPVSFLIPCHRVIRKTGAFHNYAWGVARKQAMLGWEQARYGEGAGEALHA